jgi:hypothetical protein
MAIVHLNTEMAIIRLGREREAATWNSEKYNAAIKRYMENYGYALLSDSYHEGHLPDIVMVSTSGDASSEIWIESKSSAIGLSDEDLLRESVEYFGEWLKRDRNRRFQLFVFAPRFRNPQRWEQVFGPDLEYNTLSAWLTRAARIPSCAWIVKLLGEQTESINGFFSSVELYEATGGRLQEIAAVMEEEGGFSSKQTAKRQYAEMERRMSLVNKPDSLVGNCLWITPPKELLVLSLDKSSPAEIREKILTHEEELARTNPRNPRVLPWSILSDDQLLTLKTPDSLESFSFLNPRGDRTASLNEVEELNQKALTGLLNVCVLHLFLSKGAQIHKSRGKLIFFFPLLDKNGVKEPFKVRGDKGRSVTIATPKNRLREAEDLEGAADTILTRMTDALHEELNFGFHRGIASSVRKFWGKYWVVIGQRRIYTSDGSHPMESENARKIDRFFRNPMYNRSESEFRIMRAIDKFVFHSIGRDHPIWLNQFEFHKLTECRIDFSPVRPRRAVQILYLFLDDSEGMGGES